jgi:hypothetical protein
VDARRKAGHDEKKNKRPGAIPAFVIPGRAKREPGIHQPRSGVWIPGLRQAAHPGMTMW